MRVGRLWLTDFRCYRSVEAAFADGLTVVVGANGHGKTSLLEAIGWVATNGSFRGAPAEAMVRAGAATAIVRAEVVAGRRELLIEGELAAAGRSRVQVNRQRVSRARDLLEVLRTTVFSPDDLDLVKGGPAGRRRALDDLLVSLVPGRDSLRAEVERIVRQRTALLRQLSASPSSRRGQLGEAEEATLEVWDAKLVAAGTALGDARAEVLARLEPVVAKAYQELAGVPSTVALRYEAPWRAVGLEAALAGVRGDELRRGISLVGPQRDDVVLVLDGLTARTHASQGEQRTLALAVRLGGHQLLTDELGAAPVLLLDDVFSELDPRRAAALGGAPAAGPGHPHHCRRPAPRGPARRGLHRGGRRAGGRGDGVVIPGAGPSGTPSEDDTGPTGPDDELKPVGASLERVVRRLAGQPGRAVRTVFGDWDEVVGAAVAEHARPVALDGTTLVVSVDVPAWATQLRLLEASLRARLDEVVGPGAVERIVVRVKP